MIDERTWTCHVCEDERPDSAITVLSRRYRSREGVEVTENVRYCRDRETCAAGAQGIHWLGSDWSEVTDDPILQP
jgi:hypothetical protein